MTVWSAEIKELESLSPSIKDRFPDLEKELEQLIETQDANVILIYSRRCLEVIITDLCETELKRPRKTEPLKGIIDKLSHEEKVPSHIIVSMQYLNSLSTFGAHPKEFDPEQVKPVLSNLAIIIKWYLKYKDTQIISEEKSEEVKYEREEPKETRPDARKSKKKLIILFSGIVLLGVIIVILLFVFDIINGEKKTKELEKSIAVLPFINDSPEEENTYFINGIMDEVLNNLQKIRDLSVISRTSVEQYRDSQRPTIPEIARKLGVNYIVEGSGQKYANTFRLRVQLIDASRDRHLWAESYEQEIREPDDIFSIQSQIAQSIAAALKAIITPEEKQLIERSPTTNLTAYDFYQRGREEYIKYSIEGEGAGTTQHLFNNESRAALERAEDLYHKALEYDSTFALAFTGLAWVFWNKYYWETYLSENFMDSVLILADIALSYDNQLSEAYTIKGQYYRQTGNPEQAVKEFDKAIEFNPNDWMSYYYEGLIYWRVLEDFVKSIDNLNEAVIRHRSEELLALFYSLGRVYLDAGFIDKAKYYYREALTLGGDSIRYFINLAWIEFSIENYQKAVVFLEKALKIDSTFLPYDPYYTFAGQDKEAYNYYIKLIETIKKSGSLILHTYHRIGYAFWKMGRYKEAEYYFNEQIKYGTESIKLGRDIASWMAAHYDLAGVYAFLGDKEKAYQYLNEVDKKNIFPLFWVNLAKHDPLFDNIRDEEQFQKIIQNMEAKYQAEHERVKKWLEEEGTL